MPGTVIQATSLDSVRFDCVGEGRAVTIPASVIIAIDRVLRHCTVSKATLNVYEVDGDPPFIANLDYVVFGKPASTAWGAMVNLADELERR